MNTITQIKQANIMKNQIDKLFKLTPKFKEVLTKHVIPSCSHVCCPQEKNIKIYFAKGYDVFSFKDKNEKIELSDYLGEISIHKSVTEKDFDDFIKLVESTIEILMITENEQKAKEIEAKKAELLQKLKDLEA